MAYLISWYGEPADPEDRVMNQDFAAGFVMAIVIFGAIWLRGPGPHPVLPDYYTAPYASTEASK